MAHSLAARLNAIIPSGIRRINERALELERQGENILHFELGRPDFDTPEYIKEAAKESLDHGEVFYTSNFGYNELRETIAASLRRRHNIPAQKENIIVTIGVAEALFDTLTILLNPGDEILIPDPVWMNYSNVPKLLGAVPITYSLHEEQDWQPNPEEIQARITSKTKAIVLVTPSNPTGSVIREDVLNAIADLARKHDLYVITDEIYNRILYDGRHISIASLPGLFERTITLGGFSKTYSMTGWRIGYAEAPADIILAINKIHQINTTSAASFVQKAAIAALKEESDEVENMVREYERRRNYVYKAVNAIPGISTRLPQGAFYFFLNIKDLGIDDTVLADRLLNEAHIALVPGSVFGENGKGYLRLSYAAGLGELKEGLERLNKFVTA